MVPPFQFISAFLYSISVFDEAASQKGYLLDLASDPTGVLQLAHQHYGAREWLRS